MKNVILILIMYLRIKRMYNTYIRMHDKYLSNGCEKPYEAACLSFYMIYNIDYEQFVSNQRKVLFSPFSVAFRHLREILREHQTLYDALSDPCDWQLYQLLR